MFHPSAPGAAFWTERGTTLYNELNDYMRELQQRDGYQEIKTPLLYNKRLWELSGHWGKYRENMFLVLDNESGEHDFSLKPMNCPSHYLLYGMRKHSYRELPLRYATFDVLHRNEVTGALSGLTRVRQFQQDDCHIFLWNDQIAGEVRKLAEFILGYYETFGLTATLKFATRPEQRIGEDAMWDRAEAALKRRARGDRAGVSRSSPATAPSTAPRSTSTSPIRSAGSGSWAPSSWTTPRRSGSTWGTSARTTPNTGRW